MAASGDSRRGDSSIRLGLRLVICCTYYVKEVSRGLARYECHEKARKAGNSDIAGPTSWTGTPPDCHWQQLPVAYRLTETDIPPQCVRTPAQCVTTLALGRTAKGRRQPGLGGDCCQDSCGPHIPTQGAVYGIGLTAHRYEGKHHGVLGRTCG